MKILIVIHKILGTYRELYYGYDVLYRLSQREKRKVEEAKKTLKQIFKDFVRVDTVCTEYDYKFRGCPLAFEYLKQGWEYMCSGDTNHDPEVLRDMGLKNPRDLEGLKQYLLKKYGKLGKATIIVK